MKNHAAIDNIIVSHKPCKTGILYHTDFILVSVEYTSGKIRHYFPRIDSIPKHIYSFIDSALQYYPCDTMTVYRYGNNT